MYSRIIGGRFIYLFIYSFVTLRGQAFVAHDKIAVIPEEDGRWSCAAEGLFMQTCWTHSSGNKKTSVRLHAICFKRKVTSHVRPKDGREKIRREKFKCLGVWNKVTEKVFVSQRWSRFIFLAVSKVPALFFLCSRQNRRVTSLSSLGRVCQTWNSITANDATLRAGHSYLIRAILTENTAGWIQMTLSRRL